MIFRDKDRSSGGKRSVRFQSVPVLLLLLVVVILTGTAYAGMFSLSKKIWHYRMTVSVETPEGVKTGSAVREVIYGGPTSGGGGSGWDLKCLGEAVAVDLGKRGVLFALLSGTVNGPSYCSDVLLVAAPPPEGMNKATMSPRRVPLKGQPVTLTPDRYPRFVKFRDLNDPKTVESVTKVEKMSSHSRGFLLDGEKFGNDVKIKEITLEVTDDPVTWEIDKRLTWLSNLHGGYLHGGLTSRGSPLGLHAGDFKKGNK